MTKNVLLFSGQGAQFAGMGRDLVDAYPVCRELAERANDVVGFDLLDICLNGPDEALTRSDNAQPAIFLMSVMCGAAMRDAGVKLDFSYAAGLSLGEWTALYHAGVLSFDDTVRTLHARGGFMQDACEQSAGGMLSLLGLTAAQAAEVAARSGLEVANLNSPVQTVLSGPASHLADAEKIAGELGAKRIIVLNVAGAFHSSMMQPAADRLAAYLVDVPFAAGEKLKVVSNVSACPHGTDPEEIKALMVQQVTSTVRWVDSVEYMIAEGAEVFVECGPGRVLTGLVKRIDKTCKLINVREDADIQKML